MSTVQLSNRQKITYFLFPFLMFAHGCIPFVFWVLKKTNQNLTPTTTLIAFISFWAVAIWSFRKQKNGLRFYAISTDCSVSDNMTIIRNILRENKWHIVKSTSNYIQADGSGFRVGFDLKSWGELLTVQITNDTILINSICSPDGMFAQFISFGKNKQNVRDFEMLYLQEKRNFYLKKDMNLS